MKTLKLTLLSIAVVSAVLLLTLTAPITHAQLNHRNPSALPVGNQPCWNQIYAEDFLTPASLGTFRTSTPNRTTLISPPEYANTWKVYPSAWQDTTKNGSYSPEKTLSVHNGTLDIYLHTENTTPLTAALMPVLPTMLYGKYTIRFRTPTLPGYKTAWLLWPDTEQWPDDGEIDFPENTLDGKETIHGYLHYADPAGTQTSITTPITSGTGWHTASTEWTPTHITYTLDNIRKTIHAPQTLIPHTPMHWVIQTETATNGTRPAPNTQGHILIDWVTAYTYQPNTKTCRATLPPVAST